MRYFEPFMWSELRVHPHPQEEASHQSWGTPPHFWHILSSVDRLPWPPPRMMDSWKQIWISSWSNLMPPALVHLLFTNRLDFNRTRPPWSWEAPPPPSPSRTCSNCARAAAHQASLSAPVLVQPHTLRPHLPHPELGGCSEGGRHPFVNCMGGSEVDFY